MKSKQIVKQALNLCIHIYADILIGFDYAFDGRLASVNWT